MKKNIFINMLACAFAALATFTSCDTDAEGTLYTPDADACYSFASTQMNMELSADNQGVIKVPLYRGRTDKDATIAITAQMDEATQAIFTLASSSISFKSGENIAYAELNFGSIDKLGATNKYVINLSIPEENASPSAESSIKVQAQRMLTWESYGTGIYTSQLFGQSWEQPIEKAKEGNIYRLKDCIYEGYPFVFTLSENGQELLGWDLQPSGYKHATYGMVYFTATGMEREGNILSFPMLGAVEYNGGFAILYEGFTETLELPAK